MIRGDIYQANLDPTQDSEQSGKRPVAIVSRDGINRSSPVVVIVPVTKFTPLSQPSHRKSFYNQWFNTRQYCQVRTNSSDR